MNSAKNGDNIISTSQPEMTLGGRIVQLRINGDFDSMELSKQLGVKHETYQSWELDRSEPRINKLVALAAILGVSPTYLLAEEGHKGLSVDKAKSNKSLKLLSLQQQISSLESQMKENLKQIKKLGRAINNL
ncbi:helix-turn-helix domain-containing protein [Alphaproteobacteria bacterium]|mgnify:FL=1|jgi:HTH-type transcriptional regulator, cell division transcriptional repressor|nr:helix-turn-helix domain-containing protein [Alphaproteobacteria bacterium]MDC0462476.1 helix-turn-helix domain-containing protein [Alphaproteobacteria bacterium]MDC3311863.1 helix-turn-helix domain-containing protein [Alphaproteobacteria bacterium]